ncbi:hypothetical protein HXX76_011831 [Chlamydomonas incerta]|uniref:SGNH hydrolase-type esterase domain-containing protein n=1 Tax=Chlamydomonas incerta TaxID=51695 RepID=A0A835SYC5_CHLIN|nr:hypothetical protein HXX76_011831 [Chlamydomonas incerta]|eukprot:KAG2428151.1 hypothetical protein HXX76_011831 [Chlamydomonas incerta]
MAANYTRRADVVNRGLSAYNTRWAMHTLPYIFGGGPLTPGAAGGGSAGAGGGAGAGAGVARKGKEGLGPAEEEAEQEVATRQEQQQHHHQQQQQQQPSAAEGRVLFATVLFGANDAVLPDGDGPAKGREKHVPVDEYGRNLRRMVSYMRAAGVGRVLLITTPPVWGPGRRDFLTQRFGERAAAWPLDRTLDTVAPYARAAAAAAAELGVPCLDLFNLLQQEPDWGERLLSDGLHFSPAGQARVWELMQALLVRVWPELRPEALPLQFPAWDAVDGEHPPVSFTAGRVIPPKGDAGGAAAAAVAAITTAAAAAAAPAAGSGGTDGATGGGAGAVRDGADAGGGGRGGGSQAAAGG